MAQPAAPTGPAERTASDLRRDESAAPDLAPVHALLSGRRWRHGARWIGVLFFFIGAGLLGFVFVQAVVGFHNLSNSNFLQTEVNKISGTGSPALVTAYISVVGGQLLRLMYLLLLGYLGSLISTKGIQFFAASESVIDEAVIGAREE